MRRHGCLIRTLNVCLSFALLLSNAALAQKVEGGEATLKVSVSDPNGAAISLARVRLKMNVGGAIEHVAETNQQGEAVFAHLFAGKAQIYVEAVGFEPRGVEDFTLRAGGNQAQVQLQIAGLKEEVAVAEDERERNTDPRGAAFSSVLTPEQLAQLPDDPDEFENAINELAGPGATIRVNGFRGGKLPPKSQIREIRFRRNAFAAENHERGFISVDISTKPGINSWHGSLGFGFRDEALNARPVFAPHRAPEQQRRFNFTLDGPLWKNHTSLFLSADSSQGYETKTIVAALPGGNLNESIMRPSRRLNFSGRVEHALNKTHALRFEYQRNASRQDNLGTGDFDLAERAYTLDQAEHVLRLSESGVVAKKFLNEFRFQARLQERETRAASEAPSVQVLNAFSSGGAQTGGARRARDFELADNFDFSVEKHSMRAGVLLEGGRYRSDERTNAAGTFTFANLESFRLNRPTTFTQRTGDARVSYSQYQFAWYWQDDFRVNKELMLSYGVRHEWQTNLADRSNFAPRLGLAWSPLKSGALTVRGGAGIFHDWFEAGTYEQTLRVDGVRQRDTVVRNPGFPNPFSDGSAITLPPGRIQRDREMRMPSLMLASMSTDIRIGKRFTLGTDYRYERGTHLLRGRNINAPLVGLGRPDPSAGNVVQIESSATSTAHRLMLRFAPARFTSKLFWSTIYVYGRTDTDTGGALSLPADNFNLRGERGPASNDMRHFFNAMVNRQLIKGLTLGMTFNASSALPYNIMTGFDDNGDTVSNDRPAGVGRNSARGASRWDVGARLGWGFGFGGERKETPMQGQPVIVRVGAEGGGIPSLPGMSKQRFHLDFYAQAFNLLNHANLINFSGVQTSPFFGQPTAALPGRRIETGMRFSF